MPTTKEVQAALEALAALAEAIQVAGSVPSGEIYAHAGCPGIASWERMLGLLERSGLIRRDGHLLVWIGPAREPAQP
jgi:DNA-binding IclR family transcriptional regulator